jgi:hypothetical protein
MPSDVEIRWTPVGRYQLAYDFTPGRAWLACKGDDAEVGGMPAVWLWCSDAIAPLDDVRRSLTSGDSPAAYDWVEFATVISCFDDRRCTDALVEQLTTLGMGMDVSRSGLPGPRG